MKTLYFSFIVICLSACQINDFGQNGEIKSTIVQSDMGHPSTPLTEEIVAVLQQRAERIIETEEAVPERQDYSYGGNMLVAHSRFAFIEYANLEPVDLEELDGHVNAYEGETSLFYSFEIDSDLRDEYLSMVGNSVQLNNHDRSQQDVEVVDIVLVQDFWNESPYYAAVLDVPASKEIYYGWTSSKDDINFPFKHLSRIEDGVEETDIAALQNFQQSTGYEQFNEVYENSDDEEIYIEVSTDEFESSNGTKYFAVQQKAIGICGGLVDDLTVIYVERNGELKVMATGALEHYLRDLVDVNGDEIPEVLGAGFASSSITKLQEGGFSRLQELSWSTMGCSC